mmetsp:Transcript_9039/g.23736  ORF Transcript_9039/g.23736 Transcript_9039/m.23736 type:complete len:626 (-) Transcript_9039:233-2110(-)
MGGDEAVAALAEFVRSGQLSSVALDTALGLALGVALCLIAWQTFALFEPYVLALVCAALVANALRPVRDVFYTRLAGAAPKVSALQREREQNMRMYRNYRNLGMLAAAYLLLLVLRPVRAGLFFALLSGVVLAVFLAFLLLKILVIFRAVGAAAGSAALTIIACGAVMLTFTSVFAIGIGQDVVSGVADASSFVVDAVKSNPNHQAFIAEKLQLAQDKAVELSRANMASIDAAAARLSELTGINCSEYVAAALATLESDQLSKMAVPAGSEAVLADSQYAQKEELVADGLCGTGEGITGAERCAVEQQSGSSAVSLALPPLNMDVLKAKALEGVELLKPYLPGSVGEARELAAQMRDKLEELDVEKYRALAAGAAQKMAGGLAGLAAMVADAFDSIKMAFSFALLLFLLLSMNCSSVSLVTDLLPFPRRNLNDTVELDLRFALSAMVWSTIRFFALHLAYVWMTFSALGLNFEYLAALLAGLSAALPFFPPPFVMTLLFAAPQCLAARKWAQLVALPLAHMFLGNDRDDYLDNVKQHMTVGASILNDELLTLASALGAAVFGRSGVIVAPLLITFSLVLYDIFALINKQDQDSRERLIVRDDEFQIKKSAAQDRDFTPTSETSAT